MNHREISYSFSLLLVFILAVISATTNSSFPNERRRTYNNNAKMMFGLDMNELQEEAKRFQSKTLPLLNKLKVKQPKDVTTPLILVGGLGGSALMASRKNAKEPHWWCESTTSEPFQIWLSFKEAIPYLTEDCFMHDFTLNLLTDTNNKPFLQQKDNGVRIFGKDMGGLDGVNYITDLFKEKTPYFAPLSGFLEKNGYVAGKSLRGFPYDFRLGPKEWSTQNLTVGGDYFKLKQLIEDTFYLNNGKKVALLGHSMGGPFLQYFLANFVSQPWKDKFVKSFIPVAAAFDGNFYSMVSLLIGTNYGIPTINAKSMAKVVGLFGSVPYMSPRLTDIPFVELNGKYYGRDNQYQYMKDIDMLDTWKVFQHEDVPNDIKFAAPNVTTYCVFGYGVNTTVQFSYNGPKKIKDLELSDFTPSKFRDGDGSVADTSLKVCEGFEQSYPVIVERMFNVTHVGVVYDVNFFNYLLGILQK
ncbi:hypothetical protein ABK040_013728 [Willaertia magna]